MYCDLHTHTNHSDGALTPQQLVVEAKKKNLIIALTDHNTVSGLPSFLSEAERLGVTAVGGVELSTVFENAEYHLLGLFVDKEHYEKIESLCFEYHLKKERSNIMLVNKLNDLGYPLDYSEIKKKNVKGNVNRAHIASAMVEKGYVSSVKDAFESLLDEKRGIYVPPERLELCEAIKFLREINAVPVLAHPLKDAGPERLREIIPGLIEKGLMGIETMHSSYSNEMIAISKSIAKEFSLYESGGSDYHGSVKPNVELGIGKGNLHISDDVYFNLLNAKQVLSR